MANHQRHCKEHLNDAADEERFGNFRNDDRVAAHQVGERVAGDHEHNAEYPHDGHGNPQACPDGTTRHDCRTRTHVLPGKRASRRTHGKSWKKAERFPPHRHHVRAEESFHGTRSAAFRNCDDADEFCNSDAGGEPHGGALKHVGNAERSDALQHEAIGQQVGGSHFEIFDAAQKHHEGPDAADCVTDGCSRGDTPHAPAAGINR